MRRYYPVEVEKLCKEAYVKVAQAFGGTEKTREQALHDWRYRLTKRERVLIFTIANGVVQHIYREEEGTITVEATFFEHLLACLANQKFIHDVNADGMEEGIDEVRKTQVENQRIIDEAYRRGWELLMQQCPVKELEQPVEP